MGLNRALRIFALPIFLSSCLLSSCLTNPVNESSFTSEPAGDETTPNSAVIVPQITSGTIQDNVLTIQGTNLDQITALSLRLYKNSTYSSSYGSYGDFYVLSQTATQVQAATRSAVTLFSDSASFFYGLVVTSAAGDTIAAINVSAATNVTYSSLTSETQITAPVFTGPSGAVTVGTTGYITTIAGQLLVNQAASFTAAATFGSGVTVTSGNVGVGVTSPSYPLSVKYNAGSPQITVRRSDASDAGLIYFDSSSDLWLKNSSGSQNIHVNTNSGAFIVNTDTLTPPTEVLRVTSTGRLGIGTTSPQGSLDVAGQYSYFGTSVDGARLTATGAGASANAGIWLRYTDNNAYYDSALDTRFRVNYGVAVLDAMVIKASGYVGISNLVPVTLLHVGSASTTALSAVASFQTATGTCTMTPAAAGTGMACTSDERLKSDIENVSSQYALEHLIQLQGVTYHLKKDPHHERHTGLIAQQVQKIAPEYVRKDDSTGYLQIYYDGFIPWIIESIKELHARFTTLGSDQTLQEKRIQKLEAENAELKAYLCSHVSSNVSDIHGTKVAQPKFCGNR